MGTPEGHKDLRQWSPHLGPQPLPPPSPSASHQQYIEGAYLLSRILLWVLGLGQNFNLK